MMLLVLRKKLYCDCLSSFGDKKKYSYEAKKRVMSIYKMFKLNKSIAKKSLTSP